MAADPELYVPVEDDWAATRELRLDALRHAPGAYLETLDQALARDEEGWRARLRPASGRRQLVARVGGAMIGSVTVFTGDDGRVWMVGVWVDPAHRGRGIADRLVRAQLAWCRDELCAARVWLHVGEDNPRARTVYERAGFADTGKREHVPGHPVPDALLVATLTE